MYFVNTQATPDGIKKSQSDGLLDFAAPRFSPCVRTRCVWNVPLRVLSKGGKWKGHAKSKSARRREQTARRLDRDGFSVSNLNRGNGKRSSELSDFSLDTFIW